MVRSNQISAVQHAWLIDLFLSTITFTIALGFTTWFVYGMIKDVFASTLKKAWMLKSKARE